MKKIPPKKANTMFMLILAGGAFIGLLGAFQEIGLLVALGMIIIFGDIGFRLIFFRCPHCERYLDRSTGDFCQHCGKKLDS